MTKITGSGSGSGSISQRHGSADPDPDPPQNGMDPEPWTKWGWVDKLVALPPATAEL
jgi:hypothetical protein